MEMTNSEHGWLIERKTRDGLIEDMHIGFASIFWHDSPHTALRVARLKDGNDIVTYFKHVNPKESNADKFRFTISEHIWEGTNKKI